MLKKLNFDINELNSYWYDGLILTVDRYTSLRKVAKIYGCSFEIIRGIKKEAFNKLRNPEVLLSLKDWLELFDYDDFDICKTLKK